MLVNNNISDVSLGLTSAEQRKSSQLEAEFAEYLNLKESTPEQVLSKITKNGVQSLMEHKIDEIKKHLTEKAMAARGITAEDLMGMSAEERMKVMSSIMDEVQQVLKQAINEQMKKEKQIELGYLDQAPMKPETLAEVIRVQDVQYA